MKKTLAVILLIAILPFLLGSSLNTLCPSEHSCTREDCTVCLFVSLISVLSELILGALIAVTVLALTKLTDSETAAIALPPHSERTPVWLRVKLSD